MISNRVEVKMEEAKESGVCYGFNGWIATTVKEI